MSSSQSEGAKDFLDRFVTFVAGTYRNDKCIKLLGYSLSTIAQIIRYRNGGKDTRRSEGLNQLYGALSTARVIFRMQGTAEAVWELKHLSGADGWDDVRIRPLARLQALTNVFYHPMEEVALAGGIAPKLFPVDQAWWWARSDWAWLAFCIIDMYMNVLKGRELRRREEGVRRKLRDCAESETAGLRQALSQIAASKRQVALQQLRMVFYLPNAVHWAFIKPPVHPLVVAALGLGEAAVGAVQAFPPASR
ncbi:unnamed protein product [Ectocarpus sp. 6 AP-2014]|uniref:Peroxisomal biogenesis factor 11 n=1 Tax=Ectocarpus siliculosus TaxID=2880 RepID=D8LAU5_ECTSI|nr:conserved unknown protein [Ectocarpus siliculosus]|eukprot:CBN76454.1 conserved unknown protein [Ectocarpus siliculosus]